MKKKFKDKKVGSIFYIKGPVSKFRKGFFVAAFATNGQCEVISISKKSMLVEFHSMSLKEIEESYNEIIELELGDAQFCSSLPIKKFIEINL